jgi:phosphoribosylanthranilate isomerase
MKPLRIKICGMKNKANIRAVARLSPDAMGFIFYPPSPRYVGADFDPACLKDLPLHIMKTGVFVDQGLEEIRCLVRKFELDRVQLHGSESPAFCALLRDEVQVMKAFGIHEGFDFSILPTYEQHCDYFLFDTQTRNHGGSGIRFDWNLLEKYGGHLPFYLSGGIGPEEIQNLSTLQEKYPLLYGIDLNSRFETVPGDKNVPVLQQVFNSFSFNDPNHVSG